MLFAQLLLRFWLAHPALPIAICNMKEHVKMKLEIWYRVWISTRFFFTPWCKNSFKRRLKKDTSKLPIALTPAATKQERERNKAQKKVDTVKSDGYGNVDWSESYYNSTVGIRRNPVWVLKILGYLWVTVKKRQSCP